MHWFKWQAYTTWMSGALLLVAVYYVGGRAAMTDPSVSGITHATAVVVGGRAKLVSAVSGSPAEFQVIDIESGTVERRFPLGTMKISWALTTGPDNAAYVGGNDGHLWRWAFGAATITDVGRVTSKATTVFDLAAGEDGRVWGVSYPASELWSYNPPTETISNLGTVSTDHTYARALAVDSTRAADSRQSLDGSSSGLPGSK